MEEELKYDPTGLPSDDDRAAFDEINDRLNESVERGEEEQKQFTDVRDDPRNSENWGLGGVAKELGSALQGGLQETASSVTTFVERTTDALSGEMQREKEEKGFYRPEWDPFVDYDDPIITKTWWGKLLRGTVHFGSMAVGTVLAAKGLAVTGIPVLAAGGTALMNMGNVSRAIAIGGLSDLVSKESDGHNALGSLRDHYGWIDTPLSTRDTDHPVMMKLKNIVEGMGIGLAFDGVGFLLGKGSRGVKNQIIKRNASIEDQTTTQALAQIRRGETEFRADKNKPVAARHQGAHTSTVEPGQAREQLKKTRTDWGSEDGSTGGVTTAAERERIASIVVLQMRLLRLL